MLQITRLEYVHSKGYVHCSVKPENFATGIGKKVNQVQKLSSVFRGVAFAVIIHTGACSATSSDTRSDTP